MITFDSKYALAKKFMNENRYHLRMLNKCLSYIDRALW